MMNRFRNIDGDVEKMLDYLNDEELIELAEKIMTAAETPDNSVTYFLDFSLEELALAMHSIVAFQDAITYADYQPQKDPFFAALIESFFKYPVMIIDYMPWVKENDVAFIKKLEESMGLNNRELKDNYSITLRLTKEAASILEHIINYSTGYHEEECDYDLMKDKHFVSMLEKIKGPIMDFGVDSGYYLPWLNEREKKFFREFVGNQSVLRI